MDSAATPGAPPPFLGGGAGDAPAPPPAPSGGGDLDETLFELFHEWYGGVGFDIRIELHDRMTPAKMVDLWTSLWMAKNVDGKTLRNEVDARLREKYCGALGALRLPPYMSGEALAFSPPAHLAGTRPALGLEKVWLFGLMILLDQVPRNVFRNTAAAYAGDRSARKVAEALLPDFDTFAVPLRMSIILTYVHSEDMADLEVVQGLFKRVADSRDGGRYALVLEKLRGIISNHSDRQRLFKRVPERNKWLGRPSTEAEVAYMANLPTV